MATNYYSRYFRNSINQALDNNINGDLPNYNNRIQTPGAARNTPMGQQAMAATPSAEQTGGFQWKDGYGNVGGAVANIPNAYAQGQAGVDDFSIDKYAGFKGSGQGFMSGGAIGAIAGGVSAQLGQFGEINRKLNNLDTSVDLTATSATGAPVYQGGAYVQAQDTLGALREGEDSLKGGIDPANQIFGALFGTGRKLRRKQRQIQASVEKGQQAYNKADMENDQAQMRKQDYYKRMNRTNRLYNLYNTAY